MDDQKFSAMMQAFNGKEMDKVEQLVNIKFTGRELKEFVEHCIKMNNSVIRLQTTIHHDQITDTLKQMNSETDPKRFEDYNLFHGLMIEQLKTLDQDYPDFKDDLF